MCYELEIEAVVSSIPIITPEKATVEIVPSKPTSLSLMPKPFDWIPIPAGQVTLSNGWDDKAHGVGHTFKVASFDIAKYPVTNAQFEKFIYDGGYNNENWWTGSGWNIKRKEKWTKPRYWNKSGWYSAKQPVVGVSWYEAVAFCLWLSDTTGEKITLPTEEQWQHAAQGKDAYTYPWGNQWDSSKCQNSVDDRVRQTSSVIHYEGKGDSPFGVVDMVGNVWEWCLTDYKTGSQTLDEKDIRIHRGGSWNYTHAINFRCVDRFGYSPNNWKNDLGFRIARLR